MNSKSLIAIALATILFSCGSNNGASISYEDRQEILNLISEYAYTFDEDRIEDFVQLFTDDAKTYIYFAGSETPSSETSSNTERGIGVSISDNTQLLIFG